MAESPGLLGMFDGMRRSVGALTLDPVLRETAGLGVGVEVDNAYGVAFHSTVLAGLGVDEADITGMRAGRGPVDGAGHLGAVYALARAVVRDRGRVPDTVLERATLAGLTTEEVLEVVAECAFASLVGLVDNLAGRVELDPFLVPRTWVKSG